MFVDNVKTLISALGYKVLEPLNKPIASIKESGDNSDIEDLSLHLERNIKGVGKERLRQMESVPQRDL